MRFATLLNITPPGDLKHPLTYLARILQRWKNDGRAPRPRGPVWEAPEARQKRIVAKIERFIADQYNRPVP